MVINGHILEQWQKCKRDYKINRTHKIAKWRPQSLLSACMRHAIYDLSNGKSVGEVSDRAVSYFLSAARNPGLDLIGLDVYTLAMDYTAVMRNILEYLSRQSLPHLYELDPVSIPPEVTWEFLARADEDGVLHSWKFVDYIPSDPLSELHAWTIFGDLAAAERPMILHLVAIGARSGSHQRSPWCMTYAHPRVVGIYRFNRLSGDELEGNWQPTYYHSSPKNTPRTWVDLMEKDNAASPLVERISVKEVTANDRKLFRSNVLSEAQGMLEIDHRTDPKRLPMSRKACDTPYICPHQYYCYTEGMTLDASGLYIRRDSKPEVYENSNL